MNAEKRPWRKRIVKRVLVRYVEPKERAPRPEEIQRMAEEVQRDSLEIQADIERALRGRGIFGITTSTG